MIQVTKEGILIQKTDHFFENEGVLNPGVIQIGDAIHVFYRAVSKGNISSIGYCLLSDPLTVESRMDTPLLVSELDEEAQGMEDPRIVQIDDTFYLTYTAYDGVNALGSLATSKDLVHFEKHSVMVPMITYEEFLAFAKIKGDLNVKYSRYNDPRHNYENKGEEPICGIRT